MVARYFLGAFSFLTFWLLSPNSMHSISFQSLSFWKRCR